MSLRTNPFRLQSLPLSKSGNVCSDCVRPMNGVHFLQALGPGFVAGVLSIFSWFWMARFFITRQLDRNDRRIPKTAQSIRSTGGAAQLTPKAFGAGLFSEPSRTRSNLYRWDGREVTLPGLCVLRSASMKMNWSGGAAQSHGVPCAALLTLVILSSNSVPDPERGVKSFE